MPEDLGATELPPDTVGLLEGLTTTRAVRRYRDEPVPPEVLRAVLFERLEPATVPLHRVAGRPERARREAADR
jgi:hypothetical protein